MERMNPIALPSGWTEEVDPETGNVYYFNSKTSESSWDRPGYPRAPAARVNIEMKDMSHTSPPPAYSARDIAAAEKLKKDPKHGHCLPLPVYICVVIACTLGVVGGALAALMGSSVVGGQVQMQLLSNSVLSTTQASGYAQFINQNASAVNLVSWYFWNITNPADILNGSPPNLEQIGPFVFQRSQIRQNVDLNTAADLVTFGQHTTITFDSAATIAASNGKYSSIDFPITTINLIFLGVRPQVSNLIWHILSNDVWPTDYQKLFMVRSVRDLVFGFTQSLPVSIQIPVYGTYTLASSPAPFPGFMPNLASDPELLVRSSMKMGLSDNGLSSFQMVTFEGSDHVQTLCPWGGGPAKALNFPSLGLVGYNCGSGPCCLATQKDPNAMVPVWGQEIFSGEWDFDANLVHGSNGEQFHTGVKQTERLVLFIDVAKRSIQFECKENEQVLVNGITLYRFSPTADLFQNSVTRPANARYYQFAEVNGLQNVSMSNGGADIFLSNPHFLDGDAILTTRVTGMNPDPKLHRLVIDIEPISGKAMQQFTRSQINAKISPIAGVTAIDNGWFQNMQKGNTYVPIAWMEVFSQITPKAAAGFTPVYLAQAIISNSMVAGCGTAILSGMMLVSCYYRRRKDRKKMHESYM